MPAAWQFVALMLVVGGFLMGPRIAAEERSPPARDPSATTQEERDGFWALAVVPVRAVPAGTVAADPERFYGSLLAVPAEVGDVLSPQTFTLQDGIGDGPDVIVIAPRPSPDVDVGLAVMVVGHLRPLSVAELERDYPWFDRSWIRSGPRRFEAVPVLIAASVRTEDGEELMTFREPGAPGL